MRYYEFGYDSEDCGSATSGPALVPTRAVVCRAPLAALLRAFTRPDTETEVDEKTFDLYRSFKREARRIQLRQTWQIIRLMVRR